MTSLENLGALAAMVFIAALIVVTAFPASASVVLEIPAFQLLIRHNSHTPRTTAATMLSSRRVSFRVEPDIKPDIGRIHPRATPRMKKCCVSGEGTLSNF